MNGNESVLSKICWSSPSVIPNESLTIVVTILVKISPDSLELLGLYLQWSSSCSWSYNAVIFTLLHFHIFFLIKSVFFAATNTNTRVFCLFKISILRNLIALYILQSCWLFVIAKENHYDSLFVVQCRRARGAINIKLRQRV